MNGFIELIGEYVGELFYEIGCGIRFKIIGDLVAVGNGACDIMCVSRFLCISDIMELIWNSLRVNY